MLKTTIPFIDLRGKNQIDLLRAFPDKAEALIQASRRTWGVFSYAASLLVMASAERRSHRWLKRSVSPYVHEIESFADLVKGKGVYSLNVAYEWACTSGAYTTGDTVQLLRVLDWPFPALGKHVVVALQSSKAGDYYNVTWPALSGVFNAVAPKRFAAALNLAPMRKHKRTKAGDWVYNRVLAAREKSLPASHLLRLVFEQATSYNDAKEMLCKTPLATPAIFVLTGLRPGEGCVIERLENGAEVKDLQAAQLVTASNHFQSRFADYGHGFWPRACDSEGRLRQSTELSAYDARQNDFQWLRPPILNEMTRLAMIADAATGLLSVQGFEGSAMVTECFHLPMASKSE